MRTKYWFRPKRLGGFAAYYPVNFPGWVVTFSAVFFLVYFFVVDMQVINQRGGWLHFLLEAIIIFLIYDLFCFRTGEYPSWWHGGHWRHKMHRHHPVNRTHREK